MQRASGIPCSLIISRDNEMQTSGVSRRETADVYLLFEERDAPQCFPAPIYPNKNPATFRIWISSLPSVMR